MGTKQAARRMLRALPLLAAACAAAAASADDLHAELRAGAVVDLTHALHEGMPFWPGGVPFEMTRLADYDQGYRLHSFTMGENTGTHVDAPAHFVRGGTPIDALPLADLVLPAVVIDASAEAARDPDYALEAAAVERWEAVHGRIPEGSLVIMRTGWHERFDDPAAYVNADADGVMHFPGFGESAARLLIERGVTAIGIDTLSIDPGASETFATHRAMLAAGKYQLENLANLDALPPTGATVVVGVLPVAEGTQAQARVLAFLTDREGAER
ncbi:MAG TPA: cyclase family protein [Gammaproteobacteria bacterium]